MTGHRPMSGFGAAMMLVLVAFTGFAEGQVVVAPSGAGAPGQAPPVTVVPAPGGVRRGPGPATPTRTPGPRRAGVPDLRALLRATEARSRHLMNDEAPPAVVSGRDFAGKEASARSDEEHLVETMNRRLGGFARSLGHWSGYGECGPQELDLRFHRGALLVEGLDPGRHVRMRVNGNVAGREPVTLRIADGSLWLVVTLPGAAPCQSRFHRAD